MGKMEYIVTGVQVDPRKGDAVIDVKWGGGVLGVGVHGGRPTAWVRVPRDTPHDEALVQPVEFRLTFLGPNVPFKGDVGDWLCCFEYGTIFHVFVKRVKKPAKKK